MQGAGPETPPFWNCVRAAQSSPVAGAVAFFLKANRHVTNPGLIVAASMLALATLDGCASSDRVVDLYPPVAANITIASGNNQSAQIGTDLPAPLEVSVTTADGTGVAGLTVYWTVTAGGGTISAANSITDAMGHTSVGWTLGNTAGTQSVAAIVTRLPAASFSATAVPPPPQTVVLHYDGTAWASSLQTINAMAVALSAVWGAGPSQIFAVGRCASGPVTLLFTGTGWTQPPASCLPGGSLSEFTSVSGVSASDVFRVGRFPLPPSFNDRIDHYDGQTWTNVFSGSCSFCGGLRAVWSLAHNDAVAVGDAGEIRRYDGTSWSLQASGTTKNLNAVWGVGTSVFAAGDGGTILRYDGSNWIAQTSGTTQPLYAIWGTSSTDVFAVGAAGTILHYDGSVWTAQSSGSTMILRGVWGSSGSAVFAVGYGGTILFYNGTTWTAQNTNAAINLRAVWGTSATDVYAVGTMLSY